MGDMNMTTFTHLNAGRRNQPRETLVSDRQAASLKVKTRVRAGSRSGTFKITFNQQS
jgi:hypothetical protein